MRLSIGLRLWLPILLSVHAGEAPARSGVVRTLRLRPLVKRLSCRPLWQRDFFKSAGRTRFRSLGLYEDHAEPGREATESTPLHVSIETDRGLFQAPIVSNGAVVRGHLRENDPALTTGFRDRTLGVAFQVRDLGYGGFLCRVRADGVPICTEASMIEARENGREDAAAVVIPSPGPEGSFRLRGQVLRWSDALARPLAGPRSDHQRDVWGHVTDQQIRFYPGLEEVGFESTDRRGRNWLQVQTPKGCFGSRRPTSTPPPEEDWMDFTTQVVGDVMLLKWSEGPGTIDPPDSDYAPRRHRFVACLVDTSGVPVCSDPITVLKATGRDLAEGGLAYEVADAARWDATTFEIEGRRYRVELPARD